MGASAVSPVATPQAVPDVSPTADLKSNYAELLTLAFDVLSARLLTFVALFTACIVWGFVVWDPNPLRIAAAAGFSLSVFLPMVAIYWKAGLTGEQGTVK